MSEDKTKFEEVQNVDNNANDTVENIENKTINKQTDVKIETTEPKNEKKKIKFNLFKRTPV